MIQILKLFISHLEYLFRENNFCITHSNCGMSFNSGLIVLEIKNLSLRFINERDIITLEFRFTKEVSSKWYDIDVMRMYLSGVSVDAVMTSVNLAFVKEHIQKMIDLADEEDVKLFNSIFDKLRKERAEKLFG